MESILSQLEIPLSMKKGAYLSIPVYYKDYLGEAIDLTDYTAKMQIRQTEDSEDADIELTTENGGILIDGEDGIVYIIFKRSSTDTLASDYEGIWDLWLIPTEETAFPLCGGTFFLEKTATEV